MATGVPGAEKNTCLHAGLLSDASSEEETCPAGEAWLLSGGFLPHQASRFFRSVDRSGPKG